MSHVQSDEEYRTERLGRNAALFGILSMWCGMLMVCSCYMTLLPGLGLGGAAFFMGRTALKQGADGAARAYANVGTWTGLGGAMFSLLFILLICAYIGIYALLIGFVVIAENLK